MKSGIKLARAVAKQIDEGLWEPIWSRADSSFITIQKTNTDKKLWIANGFMFCRVWSPVEYSPFGFIGKIIVHRAAMKCVAKSLAAARASDKKDIEKLNDELLK